MNMAAREDVSEAVAAGKDHPWLRSAFERLLALALAATILRAIYVLLAGLWQPLLDLHYFRQTQTALSAYWLMQGGPWFAYETPVLGAPWSIPFEFPLYQWIVALVAALGVPLDGAGRLVSFAFYVGTLWPLYSLFKTASLGRVAYLATSILFMTAPLYLYWSRTFMIESCALFFSSVALAYYAEFLRRRTIGVASVALAAGTIATLVKATTFPAFAFAAGCLLLIDLHRRWRKRFEGNDFAFAMLVGVLLVAPFVLGYAWVVYTDQIKSANELGRLLTSASLGGWNFGSWAQRASSTLWDGTILRRVLPDLFGPALVAACICAGAALARPRYFGAAALTVVCFLLPFMLFTNLHIVHNYYQYANGLFALAAAGIGVAAIADQGGVVRRIVAGVLLIAMLIGQVIHFRQVFAPEILRDRTQAAPLLSAAKLVRDHAPVNSSVLVFGDDWASTVPYYSHRKGLAVPYWAPATLVDLLTREPRSILLDPPLGAIVVCRDRLNGYTNRANVIIQFSEARELIGRVADCEVRLGAIESKSP